MQGSHLLLLGVDDVGVKVEIAFNAGYSTPAADRVWTDVTDQVLIARQTIEIQHGRGDEFSTADANSCSLALKNLDGRFTPGKATSPYYPNVKIGRPLRVTKMTAAGHTSVRFVGFIDEWVVAWPDVVDDIATTSIVAYSRIARLGQSTSLRSIVEEEILLDGPVAYYTLGEAEGATFASDASGNGAANLVQAGAGAAVTFGTGTGPGTDGLTAATFAAGKYLRAPSVDGLDLEFWFATSTSGRQALLLSDGALGLIISSGNKLAFQNGVIGVTELSSGTVNDGGVHHVAWDDSTGETWLDGVSLGSAPALMGAGRYVGGDPSGLSTTLTGSMAHAAFFSTLSSTRITAHYNAGSTGFAGETPAARLARYASYAGIPSGEVSAETGETTMAHFDITGMGVLEAMRRAEESESGVLFDGRDGTLTFHSRSRRYSAAAGLTLDAGASQVQADYAPKLDRSAIVNVAQVSNVDGSVSVEAVASASRSEYGEHGKTVETAAEDDEEPFQRAWWTVNTYAEPSERAPLVSVEVASLSQVGQQLVLDANVGTRVDIANLPSQAADTTASYFVEGYTESIGPTTHRVSFNLSPSASHEVWTVEDPVYGQYDAYGLAY